MLPYLFLYLDDERDERLLEDIFNSYAKQMFLLAKSYLHHDADAEDAVATVFERIASKNFDVVRGIRSDVDLRNYLLKATKNTSLNILSKNKRTAIPMGLFSDLGIKGIENLSDDGFLEQVLTKMESEDVLEAILDMDETYSTPLYYHFVLEKTIPETAKLLFQSVSATKQQLVRGKKLLLTKLHEKEEE